MMKSRAGQSLTREQVRRAVQNLVRQGLVIKREEPGRGTVYVAAEFATEEEVRASEHRSLRRQRRRNSTCE